MAIRRVSVQLKAGSTTNLLVNVLCCLVVNYMYVILINTYSIKTKVFVSVSLALASATASIYCVN